MVFHLFYDIVLKRNRETDIALYVRHGALSAPMKHIRTLLLISRALRLL